MVDKEFHALLYKSCGDILVGKNLRYSNDLDAFIDSLWDKAARSDTTMVYSAILDAAEKTRFSLATAPKSSAGFRKLFVNALAARSLVRLRWSVATGHQALLTMDPVWLRALRSGSVHAVRWTITQIRFALQTTRLEPGSFQVLYALWSGRTTYMGISTSTRQSGAAGRCWEHACCFFQKVGSTGTLRYQLLRQGGIQALCWLPVLTVFDGPHQVVQACDFEKVCIRLLQPRCNLRSTRTGERLGFRRNRPPPHMRTKNMDPKTWGDFQSDRAERPSIWSYPSVMASVRMAAELRKRRSSTEGLPPFSKAYPAIQYCNWYLHGAIGPIDVAGEYSKSTGLLAALWASDTFFRLPAVWTRAKTAAFLYDARNYMQKWLSKGRLAAGMRHVNFHLRALGWPGLVVKPVLLPGGSFDILKKVVAGRLRATIAKWQGLPKPARRYVLENVRIAKGKSKNHMDFVNAGIRSKDSSVVPNLEYPPEAATGICAMEAPWKLPYEGTSEEVAADVSKALSDWSEGTFRDRLLRRVLLQRVSTSILRHSQPRPTRPEEWVKASQKMVSFISQFEVLVRDDKTPQKMWGMSGHCEDFLVLGYLSRDERWEQVAITPE